MQRVGLPLSFRYSQGSSIALETDSLALEIRSAAGMPWRTTCCSVLLGFACQLSGFEKLANRDRTGHSGFSMCALDECSRLKASVKRSFERRLTDAAFHGTCLQLCVAAVCHGAVMDGGKDSSATSSTTTSMTEITLTPDLPACTGGIVGYRIRPS